jgi:hypothetical protein
LLKGADPTQKEFVGLSRGTDETGLKFVVAQKIPWEDFKASNCRAIIFMHYEGLALYIILIKCNVVHSIGYVNTLRSSHTG